MLCFKCQKEVKEKDRHSFSGYGFYIVYHPECCPKECDGTVCDLDHPEEDKIND